VGLNTGTCAAFGRIDGNCDNFDAPVAPHGDRRQPFVKIASGTAQVDPAAWSA
jgi:hypothetical protein